MQRHWLYWYYCSKTGRDYVTQTAQSAILNGQTKYCILMRGNTDFCIFDIVLKKTGRSIKCNNLGLFVKMSKLKRGVFNDQDITYPHWKRKRWKVGFPIKLSIIHIKHELCFGGLLYKRTDVLVTVMIKCRLDKYVVKNGSKINYWLYAGRGAKQNKGRSAPSGYLIAM